MKQTYYVQEYFPFSGWTTNREMTDFKKSVQRCESLLNKNGARKTRVAILKDNKLTRVHPPMKDKTGQIIKYCP